MTRPEIWERYTPSSTAPWNRARVAHLHRRAGFGPTAAAVEQDLADGPESSVTRFLEPAARRAEDEAVSNALRSNALQDLARLQAWWLHRMLYSSDPLREKLALFWHDHFATSVRKVESLPAMADQNDLLRHHALGRFSELLGEITGDAAMLVWLDGGNSQPPHPNENYAREFFELFTLGVGHYTEADIKEAARAFTGWRPLPRREDQFLFEPDRFDAGEKTVLGRRGAFGAEDVVHITLERPAAARFLCRKLYAFLISESQPPREEWIDALATEFRDSGFHVGHVVEVILRSRLFFSEHAIGQRVQCPVEWSLGLVRMLGVSRHDLRLLSVAETCARQGQPLFAPPGVDGWEWGPAWLGSAAVLERTNWAARILWGSEEHGLRPFDPVAFCDRHGIQAGRRREGLARLLGGSRSRAAAANEPTAHRAAADAEGVESLRSFVHRWLAEPEAQLA